ncbi:MAG TPA: radical SAM protein [Candidatus Sulfotelmatobacter sp.]|nr:radical SAM protein [Candidatus Sulfotelmatobacter sp.]
MKIALIGAELEENLGLRYIASALEANGHFVEIFPFNSEEDTSAVIRNVLKYEPSIVGLSMVFTGRAREFCRLAKNLREFGCSSHIVAGGHFASFNCERLLIEYPSFDSVAVGEGEDLMCALADHLDNIATVPGLCYRGEDGKVTINPGGNRENLDSLPFPKRGQFHDYFGKRIGSILSSRGCWRNCAFCSINAWYKKAGGKKFRYRSVDNIVAEMKQLYFDYNVRIFNFQDDTFFLPNQIQATNRFRTLRQGLKDQKVDNICIAIKARPDSINREAIEILDDLGLFRVFLGVENASTHGLKDLNRRQTIEDIMQALEILNSFDVHVAYNFLMFEPDTTMEDILKNIRFMERHLENPFNFCRAEAYAGTGLESTLRAEGRLLGSYFGFDYRLKDPKCELFHQIANHAFFERNFSDFGLHYFNMQVDFYYQLMRRFYPNLLSETLRSQVRAFIKQTNLDTHHWLCQIYDFMQTEEYNEETIASFSREMRQNVDMRSAELRSQGESIINWMEEAFKRQIKITGLNRLVTPVQIKTAFQESEAEQITPLQTRTSCPGMSVIDLFGLSSNTVPYNVFKKKMEEDGR